MAIDLTVQYPGKVGAATTQFPYGIPQNISAPGDGTGTPWEAALVKDNEGYKQALLKSAGIVPSGTPDEVGASQYMQSIVELASGRAFNYDESGVANAYVLDARSNQQAPASLYVGMVSRFIPGATNTLTSTADVGGTGVKTIKDERTGAVLVGGEMPAGVPAILIYDGIDHILVKTVRFYKSSQQTITSAGLLTLPHLLGIAPERLRTHLVCQTAEGGYSINDVVEVAQSYFSTNVGMSVVSNATNILIRYGSGASVFPLINKTTGASFSATNGNWKLVVSAWT